MFYMNNVSYLTHAELARWEWSSFGGILDANLRSRSYFIVTASMIRFRREIPPLRWFDIETRIGGVDERNLWVYQTFHNSNDASIFDEKAACFKHLEEAFRQSALIYDEESLK